MKLESQAQHTNPRVGQMSREMCGWRMAALFLGLGVMTLGSLPALAQQGSLADAARQARAQKQAQSSSEASSAQQIADELSEDQNDVGAPGGFKTYNAGDYKLWVPAPYRVQGHDDAGIVLAGPNVGLKHPIVLVGTPVVAHFGNNDDAFHDTAMQFAHLYAQSTNCVKATIANHAAFQCGMAAGNLLGDVVSGSAVFVRGATNFYPVFCFAPTSSRSRDVLNNGRANINAKLAARDSLNREEDDVKQVMQKCDTVFQSIVIRDGAPAEKGATASANAANGAAKAVGAVAGAPDSASAAASNGADAANAGGLSSLAEVAHQLRQPAGGSAAQPTPDQSASAQPSSENAQPAPGSTVPAGFKVQAFNYCKSATQCWDASVLVPAEAKLVSTSCKQYIYEIKVKGQPFLLLAGPAGDSCSGHSANDPSQVQWKHLVDPESARAPGTSSTISAQQMPLDGQPAVITKMRFKWGFADWIGKRAEIEANGAQLVVGCMAPKDTYNDGDDICTRLIESLQMP